MGGKRGKKPMLCFADLHGISLQSISDSSKFIPMHLPDFGAGAGLARIKNRKAQRPEGWARAFDIESANDFGLQDLRFAIASGGLWLIFETASHGSRQPKNILQSPTKGFALEIPRVAGRSCRL
jgi:hypothetical protein